MTAIDLVQEHLGPNEIRQIGQQLGLDPATAQRAVDAALPNLVAGMAGHAQQPDGASSIEGLLGSHGGILGNLGSILAAGGVADGGGILGSILGRHTDTVNTEVQQSSGLDSAKTRQLLMMLAPIVLSALAHRRQQNQTNVGTQPDLGEVLKHEAHTAEKKSPGMGGLLGKILSKVETRPT